MTIGADYSYARPRPQELVAAGYTVVARYLSDDARGITAGEMRALHDAGMRVMLIAESGITRPRSGYAGGSADVAFYNRLADSLGAPGWLPIFYACDVGDGFPATSDFPAIRDYAEGFLSSAAARPAGQYGPYPVVELLRDVTNGSRRIEHWWQCAGGSGSGQGTGGSIRTGDGSVRRLSDLACMFQHVGSVPAQFVIGGEPQIDHNDVLMDPTAWAWHPDMPGPTHPPEDDMAPPVIMTTRPDSQWAGAVGDQPGGRYLAYPSSGIIVRIHSDDQVGGDEFLGVKDLGVVEDRFFYNYALLPPAQPGPVLARPKPNSQWAAEKGVTGAVLLYPSGVAVPVRDDGQAAGDRYIGVPDRGELDDQWLRNYTLQG